MSRLGIVLVPLLLIAHGSAGAQEPATGWSLRGALLPKETVRFVSEAADQDETLPQPKPILGLSPYAPEATAHLVEAAALSGNATGALKTACVGDGCPLMQPAYTCHERWLCLLDHCSEQWLLVCSDYKNMYLSWNVLGLGAAIGIAAPLANTSADERVQNWLQRQARGGDADRWASDVERYAGYGTVIPVVVVAAIGGQFWGDTKCGSVLGDWGTRSTRALLVGAPTVVILQVALGAGEPGSANGAAWRPRHDGREAVAAEAFVGAVPFLSAASMTDIRPLRWALVGGSFITTWANLHNDSNYLSQALLGWSIAALATCSVNQSNAVGNRVHFVPLALPQGVGAGVQVHY
jgi:hypothetical protein